MLEKNQEIDLYWKAGEEISIFIHSVLGRRQRHDQGVPAANEVSIHTWPILPWWLISCVIFYRVVNIARQQSNKKSVNALMRNEESLNTCHKKTVIAGVYQI